MTRIKRPSPALVVAILALVAAIVVPAYAALTKGEKKTVKKLANAQITKRAPGLAVASARSAGNADKLDGLNATDFVPAGRVRSPNRFVLNDPVAGDAFSEDPVPTLVSAGAFEIKGICFDANSGAFDEARVRIDGPIGSSYSGTGTDGTLNNGSDSDGMVTIVDALAGVESAQITANTPSGQVVSVNVSAEVGDPAGDCVFGVTAIGP